MSKDRRLHSERVIQFQMLGGICEVVLSSNHMGDSHFGVIDHIHKMEDPGTVRTSYRHIRIETAVKLDVATDQVIQDHRFAGRTKPNRTLIFVYYSLLLKQFQVAFVNFGPFALKIGAIVTASVGPLIPIKPQPAKTVVNNLDGSCLLPTLVSVLNA